MTWLAGGLAYPHLLIIMLFIAKQNFSLLKNQVVLDSVDHSTKQLYVFWLGQ